MNQREGLISVQDIVARTAQHEHTIQRAIGWLSANTALTFDQVAEDNYIVSAGGDAAGTGGDTARLNHLLQESRAYAAYWMKQAH
jgi:hypothetical protein